MSANFNGGLNGRRFSLKREKHSVLPIISLLLWLGFAFLCPDETTAATPPRIGGELNIGISEACNAIDPVFAKTAAERQISSLITEALFDFDGKQVKPILALSYEYENSGKDLRILLRPNIYFHDGTKLKTEDVKSSYERILRSGVNGSWRLLPIKGAKEIHRQAHGELAGFETVSPYEFVLHMEKRIESYAASLADPSLAILPSRFGKYEKAIDKPVGSGPFKVASHSSRFVQLAAFDSHHKGRSFLDRLNFTEFSGKSAERTAIKSGKIDAMLYGRLSPKGIAREMRGVIGLDVVLAMPERNSTMMQFWRDLIPCEEIVRIFERRLRAPFASEAALKVKTIRKTDKSTAELAESIGKGLAHSCIGFCSDKSKAKERFRSSDNETAFIIAVEDRQTELKLMAERISLTAKKMGIDIQVLALSKGQKPPLDAFRIDTRKSYKSPEERKWNRADEELVLYRLLPRLSLVSDDIRSLSVSIWGFFDFSDTWRENR